jgi:cell division protein FtsN
VSDEGFREIQLNGKQLVFLAMAATVVLVVCFLLGVLVGRGVWENVGTAETEVADVRPDPDAMMAPDNPPPLGSTPPVAPPPAAESAPPAEELSYAERLLRDEAPAENLKESPPQAAPPLPAPAPIVREPVATQPPPAASPSTPAAAPESTASDPSGPGFAVQVAAYRDRREADTLAKQLIAKGYPAFVMDPVKGAPTAMFRVRVGKYKTLKDAEAISTRLQAAEQFKPWIAR